MELTFNGVSLAEAVPNAFVEHFPNFVHAEKDLSITAIPGRNGDVVFDDGTYRNVLISYPIAIRGSVQDLGTYQDKLYAWLHPKDEGQNGYYVLQNDQDLTTYRLAFAYGGAEFENIYGRNTRGTITFDCRPEKFLRNITPLRFTSAGSIDNRAYNYPARPNITLTVSGTGTLTIYETGGNMYRVKVSDLTNTVYIDGDTQDAYLADGTNVNNKIELSGVGSMPILEPGIIQSLTLSGNISAVTIEPRYYTI